MVDFNAFWLSLYISGSYVAAIYATHKGSENYPSGRDDPRVIRRRIKRVCLISLLNIFKIPWILHSQSQNLSYTQAFLNLGLIPGYYRDDRWDLGIYFYDIGRVVTLIFMLYVGPLLDSFLYLVFASRKRGLREFKNEVASIWGIRNYIFAPFTEELFYTSMILNTYLALKPRGELNFSLLIWQTPLFFGLAHLHHAYELHQQGMMTWPAILLNTLFQTTYTTLFGSLTNYIFIKSGGNLWACIVVHAICNYMGFPESSRLETHFSVVKRSNNIYIINLIKLWKKCYIILLLMGLLFFKNFYAALIESDKSIQW